MKLKDTGASALGEFAVNIRKGTYGWYDKVIFYGKYRALRIVR